MKRIWLIRHGRPDYGTPEPRCIGITDVPLSREGEMEMLRLGLRAAEQEREFLKSACFYTSPLERAVSSGKAFLKGAGLPDAELTAFHDLMEVNLGTWDGLSFREIREAFPEEYRMRGEHPGTFRTPGGETLEEAGRRFLKAVRKLSAGTESNLVIFGHSGAVRAGLCALENISADSYRNLPQPFGGVTELNYDSENGSLIFLGRVFI